MGTEEAARAPASRGTWPDMVMTRVLQAPRALVFRAWTEPARVAAWWGPDGFSIPTCELDVRTGGAIKIDMLGPDGTVYPMSGTYREVVPPERLAFVSSALDGAGQPLFENLCTVTFEDLGDATRLTVRNRVLTMGDRAAPFLAGQETGWAQQLGRLAAYLAS